ncbi:hypothetical protein CLV47_12347 [Antricoccus suffuscus]|uniref:DUF4913 domain-containing protein n=1 Tax=Antricoccus suffuscus TaxID=1629062 RepID=A0A2T0ZEP4_9ACTN|nr:hypothetical protein [Antricoccus suffuscus]PRZ34815.1 hypothetical protein CLV47_12347 [Antricoccus suffuscus]
MTERILGRFPEPPKDVRYIMLLLDQAKSPDPEEQEQAEIGADDAFSCKVVDLPRPWDPAELPPQVRQEYWLWLDDVALWVNHTYGWRPAEQVPACWPQHPWLVTELATLAMARWVAFRDASPMPAEEWHQWSMPRFVDRLTQRMGTESATQCTKGRHAPWPGESRAMATTAAADDRQQLFADDVTAGHSPAVKAAVPATTPARH